MSVTTRKLFLTVLIAAGLAIVAGCAGSARQTVTGSTSDRALTRTPVVTSTRPPVTAAATATPSAGHTPPPTRDVISELVTQAYILLTPAPRSTQPPLLTAGAISTLPPNVAALLTPTATLNPAPASVIFSEPILIPNAVNTADCKIRSGGDCAPMMQADTTLFFTWTFGVRGATPFEWGQAAVVITRNGQPFKWSQVGNMARVPNPDKNESWTLNVGETAAFSAGLDKAQPGYYTARLVMCPLSLAECNQGQGWQNVGGDTINFVITP